MSTLEKRFWAKVDTSGDCWTWTAALNTSGYGVIKDAGKMKKAHRLSYEFDNGPIPDGLQIDHICRHRSCVNPDHLRAVTHKQNNENLDGPHGHNVTSGIRGVYRHPNGKWQARVAHNKKIYSAGYFTTAEQASAAVTALRNELHTHNDADRREA